jgi:hypothetical protein
LRPPAAGGLRNLDQPLQRIEQLAVPPMRHEFEGHGIGKLLVPLLARRLAKQLPRDEQKLKELLERGAYAQT